MPYFLCVVLCWYHKKKNETTTIITQHDRNIFHFLSFFFFLLLNYGNKPKSTQKFIISSYYTYIMYSIFFMSDGEFKYIKKFTQIDTSSVSAYNIMLILNGPYFYYIRIASYNIIL